jgi:hypothetical protein
MTRNFSKALRASDNPQTFSKALRASDDLRPACELRRPDFFLRRAVGARRSWIGPLTPAQRKFSRKGALRRRATI